MGKERLERSPGEDLHSCSWELGTLPPERSNRIYHRCLTGISALENLFEHASVIDRQLGHSLRTWEVLYYFNPLFFFFNLK